MANPDYCLSGGELEVGHVGTTGAHCDVHAAVAMWQIYCVTSENY